MEGNMVKGNMIKQAIQKTAAGHDLTFDEARQVMDEIMGGEASQVQMASYLTALSLKGETIDEITASAAGMRSHCIPLPHERDVLEIVGTGGDKSNSFNISTTSALVVSAAGVPVAKHGNRAASSKCGAACGHYHTAGKKYPAVGRHRYLLFICTELPHCHEICGAGAQGAGHPHGI